MPWGARTRSGRRRLYVLLAIAAIVIPGTFAYIEFWLARPVGEGPAGPHVDAKAFSQPWTSGKVKVVGIGDSTTAGLGAKSPSHTFLGHGSHCRLFWRSAYDASDPHYWFFTNIEDPNDRGYDAIRRVFLNTIAEKTKLRQGSSPAPSTHTDEPPDAILSARE